MRPGKQESRRRAPAFLLRNERSLLLLLGAALLRSLLLFRSHCSLHGEGVERRSNPPVDWSAAAGCEHPTGSARRQNFIGAKLRQTDFLKQQSGGATFRWTITTCTTKPAMEPGFALDNHLRTLKGVKQTSRSCKGGASNLPTTPCVSASEALS